MKKILKPILLILTFALVVSAFALVGCNKKGEGGTEPCEHIWNSWTTTKEATCTEKGEKEHTCSVCDKTEKQEIAMIGHNFNDQNICTVCEYELVSTAGLEYELVEEKNNSYYIVKGIGNANVKEIVVPAYHAGKSVTMIAEKAFYGNDYITSVYLPNTINSIDKEAFYWCENLTQLTISNPKSSSLSIGEKAFYGCAKLNSISLPANLKSIYSDSFENTGFYKNKSNYQNGILNLDGWILKVDNTSSTELTLSTEVGVANYAFSNSNITTLTIENSKFKFLDYSFAKSKIVNVSLPASLITYLPASQIVDLTISSGTLNSQILNGFGRLEKLTIQSLTGYFHNLFGTQEFSNSTAVQRGTIDSKGNYTIDTYGTYYVPSNLKEITVSSGKIIDCAFSECSMLEKITIGDEVTSIGDAVFYHSSNLTSVTIGESVTSIGIRYVYYECTRLETVNWNAVECLPTEDSLKDLFIDSNCINLKTLNIGRSVKAIPYSVIFSFVSCKSIESITVADGNTAFKSVGNCLIEIENRTLRLGCKNSRIPTDGSVTAIGFSAFENCPSLTSITIPDSVTSIGAWSFKDCSGLTTVTIGNGVTSIGNYAFYGCSSLTSIAIPDGVTSIGSSAFDGCSSLTSITIPDSVTSIGDYAFYDCRGLTSVTFENITGWWYASSDTATSGTAITGLDDPATAANLLTSTRCRYYWKRS